MLKQLNKLHSRDKSHLVILNNPLHVSRASLVVFY